MSLNRVFLKAGRKRWLGIRPTIRGVANRRLKEILLFSHLTLPQLLMNFDRRLKTQALIEAIKAYSSGRADLSNVVPLFMRSSLLPFRVVSDGNEALDFDLESIASSGSRSAALASCSGTWMENVSTSFVRMGCFYMAGFLIAFGWLP